jgi:hypothetical protein
MMICNENASIRNEKSEASTEDYVHMLKHAGSAFLYLYIPFIDYKG